MRWIQQVEEHLVDQSSGVMWFWRWCLNYGTQNNSCYPMVPHLLSLRIGWSAADLHIVSKQGLNGFVLGSASSLTKNLIILLMQVIFSLIVFCLLRKWGFILLTPKTMATRATKNLTLLLDWTQNSHPTFPPKLMNLYVNNYCIELKNGYTVLMDKC